MSADGFQLIFPFAPFRKLLSLDDADLSVKRKVDMPVFWEEIVSNVADAWKTKDVSTTCFVSIRCSDLMLYCVDVS